MCLVIVPLAGPDFYSEKFGIRPLFRVGQTSLIEHVLGGRPWVSDADTQLVFVLRDTGEHTRQMQQFLLGRYPRSQTVVLGSLTAGAPFSALAGLALSRQHDQPVIIDLADISFDIEFDATTFFRENVDVDGVVPFFLSDDPKFSYMQLDGMRVLQAREKQVISANASAGVYLFRDSTTYLRALMYALQEPDVSKVGAAYFVCPSVNGLISQSRHVHAIQVSGVQPIGALFHDA